MLRTRMFKILLLLIVLAAILLSVLFSGFIDAVGIKAYNGSSLSYTMQTRMTEITATMSQPPSSRQACQGCSLVVKIVGRLGNLMFGVASGFGMAQQNQLKYEMLCSDGSYQQLVSTFPRLATIPCASDITKYSPLTYAKWGTFDENAMRMNTVNSVMIHGYLQSYKYFWKHRNAVKQMFEFSSAIRSKASTLLKEWTLSSSVNLDLTNATRSTHLTERANITTVGVHIRRGDYLQPHLVALGYVLPDSNYFKNAFDYFRTKFKRALFVVLSEDVDWCSKNMNFTDAFVRTSGDPAVDMCILTMTNHIIISVGTFSWWSAFLSQGQVAYFRKITRPESELQRGLTEDDFFPGEWIGF